MKSKPEEVAPEDRVEALERALTREQAKTRALADISAALGSTPNSSSITRVHSR